MSNFTQISHFLQIFLLPSPISITFVLIYIKLVARNNKVQYWSLTKIVEYMLIYSVSTLNLNFIVVVMPEVYSPHPDYDFVRDFKGYGESGLNLKWPNNAKLRSHLLSTMKR